MSASHRPIASLRAPEPALPPSSALARSTTAGILTCALGVGGLPAPARAQAAAPERTIRIDLLDNGDFTEVDVTVRDSAGLRPIPWWRTTRGFEQIERDERPESPERYWGLRTRGPEIAEQPVAAYAPLARSIEVRGRMQGAGRVVLIDGASGRASLELTSPAGTWREFRLGGDDFAAQVGRDPIPRFLVRLEAADDSASATWQALSAVVELPCPSPAELRAEVLELLRTTVRPWLERGLDEEGPRATGFLCHVFDALTGKRLESTPGFLGPLFGELGWMLTAEDVPEWRTAYERFLESFLELSFEPATGLPRLWDPRRDEPLPDRPVEIGLVLNFLIDVVERGPERFRARARERAVAIGETVLARGSLPDGNIAASYFPADGTVNTGVAALRRFDVPAQLARLSALAQDPRYLSAASEALATFEFTHFWAGTWDAIDPGFDDDFGHYGARAATIALTLPDEKLFRRFALEGLAHYRPLWRDALRLGGNIAADQVRCWIVALDLARCEPALRADTVGLLRSAARSHFKGEQYAGGAWGDVTIYRFDPKSNLQVGDYPGTPQNLLHGLAVLHAGSRDGEPGGLRREELRAMYTAVLRSTVEVYKRPYGFLLDRGERRGANSAAGSLRMLLGLRKMLAAL